MNRSELAKALAEETGITPDDAANIVNQFFRIIQTALLEGNRVEIRGFGSFKVREYRAYAGRNPKTGERIEVMPKKTPYFKCGLELRELVNKD